MQRNVTYPTFSQLERQEAQQDKTDLQSYFTTGDDWYPKNRQATLHLLYKYIKSSTASQPTSEGAAFSQKGGNRDQIRDKNP